MTRVLQSLLFALAKVLVLIAFPAAPLAAAPVILSQQLLSWWASSAVDAKGVRHQAKDCPKGHAPWTEDVTKQIAPEYSKLDQAHRLAGFGLYRVAVGSTSGVGSQSAICTTVTFIRLAADISAGWRMVGFAIVTAGAPFLPKMRVAGLRDRRDTRNLREAHVTRDRPVVHATPGPLSQRR